MDLAAAQHGGAHPQHARRCGARRGAVGVAGPLRRGLAATKCACKAALQLPCPLEGQRRQRQRQRQGASPPAPAAERGPCALFFPPQRQHRRRPCAPPAASAAHFALPQQLLELQSQPGWDVACMLLAAVAAYGWVKLFDRLAGSGALDRKLSRKLVHATAGPLFMLTWPLFSAAPEARFFAAAVPALNATRLLLVGSGALSDPGLVKSTSRGGGARELLGGPLYYVAVLAAITAGLWRAAPAGLVAVSMVCGGDGLADIVGRRWGAGNPLPWNAAKSWAGSAAMALGGAAMALGFILAFSALGYFPSYELDALLPRVAAVSVACTLVESLPINTVVDDNLSVPAVGVALTAALLPA
ncbi:phytol kinase chloroplastic-like [Raphidocelis subcapitata]|uniref:phytol kinase n=1 Tax=Raphidocelis subcapitata TaxID=307507 RepID=A0A2V0PEZ4_9CHLO|nr:phytol kinase chloroplastic-like [Raphidocelis subcapitata]|eukprot:GBF95757.1 phytol kinase chloroplastic-like [Raphidocelis subcapitata]